MHAPLLLQEIKIISDILANRQKSTPNKIAYQFYINPSDVISITYSELYAKALSIASHIKKHTKQGDRVLLVYEPGIELITALFGSFYAGTIAVMAYPPVNEQLELKLNNVMSNCDPALVMTTQRVADYLKVKLKIPMLIHSSLEVAQTKNYIQSGYNENSIAFLQYSSGSTGIPKGVMVTHKNIVSNISLLEDVFKHRKIKTVLGWLPPYHDMGLIITILSPIYYGLTSVLTSPEAFIKCPKTWLKIISKYPNVYSGAPNFAYDYCCDRVLESELSELDLSNWAVAFNAAEPIRHETMEKFYQKFSKAGLKRDALWTGYGLAEATLIVSMRNSHKPVKWLDVCSKELSRGKIKEANYHGKNNGATRIVSSGEPIQQIKIVDPKTKKVVDQHKVGEVWINDPCVTAGYFNDNEKTIESFQARVHGESANICHFRTGDLGFIRDNELYICGRLKDIIKIHGLTYHAHDIEQTVIESDEHILSGYLCAFKEDKNNDEVLSLLIGVKSTLAVNEFVTIAHHIREAVGKIYQLPICRIIFVNKKQIPKTTSGKIRRAVCKEWLLANKLDLLFEDDGNLSNQASTDLPLSNPLVESIMSILAQLLKKDQQTLSPKSEFSTYGLDSIRMADIALALSQKLNINIDPAEIYKHSSPVKLAAYVLQQYPVMKEHAFAPSSSELTVANDPHFSESDIFINFRGVQTKKVNHIYNTFTQLKQQKKVGLSAKLVVDKPNYYIFDTIKPTPMLSFISCSYLGLEWDKRVRAAVIEAASEAGSQFSASRAFASIDYYEQLENLIEKAYGVKPIISQTTTLGHLSAMPTVIDEYDAIILDEQVHNSVSMAAKLCAVNGTSIAKIKHNSISELIALLNHQALKNKKHIWYCADGLYSMYGDFAPIEELLALAEQYPKLHFYIDDAHSLGWIGDYGTGFINQYKHHPCFNRIILAGSFAKACAATGGLILTQNDEWREKIASCGETMIFSGPIQPPLLNALIAVYKLFLTDELTALQQDLKQKIAYFNQLLHEHGLTCLSTGKSPIFYVKIGNLDSLNKVCHHLHQHNFHVSPTGFPAVSPDKAGLRITLNCLHQQEDLKRLVETIASFPKV